MSLRSWWLLLLIYIANLFLGALLFHTTECPAEVQAKALRLQADQRLSTKINRMKEKLDPDELEVLGEIVEHWTEMGFVFVEGVLVDRETNTSEIKCDKWGYQNSFFFSFTVVSTIGYGHQAPTTTLGRMICIFYALIGIPINAMLIGALGAVFSTRAHRAKTRVWESLGRSQAQQLDQRPKLLVVIVETLVFFTLFFVMFLPVPALLFTFLENKGKGFFRGNWGFFDSLYYTFITLSTIGFGDMVPDRQTTMIETDFGRFVYLSAIIIWIILGMGYIFGVINIIGGTLKAGSKPVKKAFQGLRNQIHLDDYWRKIIGEIIMIKRNNGAKVEDDILSGCGGGSEPCLVHAECVEHVGLRKVFSTGDLKEYCVDREDLEISRPISRAASLSSEDLLASSSSGLTKSISSEVVDVDLESEVSLNHDTITSLRQFLTSAHLGQRPHWVHNELQEPLNPPGIRLSRKGSLSNRSENMYQNEHSRPTFRRRSSTGAARLMRNTSQVSNGSQRSQRSGMSSLLSDTTLGEFLAAAENVRIRSEAEAAGSLLASRQGSNPSIGSIWSRQSSFGRLGTARRAMDIGAARRAVGRRLSFHRLGRNGHHSPQPGLLPPEQIDDSSSDAYHHHTVNL